MILIVGLGNPGKEYEKTRHNAGFRAIDELLKNKKEGTVLAKPQTFMNNSGQAVFDLAKYYKLKPENIWIIHDDIDLPVGSFKMAKNRGSAGHKGVESVIKYLKTKNFNRIRIGICPKTGKPKTVEKFVLQNFTEEEKKLLDKAIKESIIELNKQIK